MDALWTTKTGTADSATEDGWSTDHRKGVMALADGASASHDAGRWARVLAQGFCQDPPRRFTQESFNGWLERRLAEFGDFAEPERTHWYSAEAASRGAAATIVAVAISRNPERRLWRAMAVGDADVFLVRDGVLLFAGPVDDAEMFNDHPDLLATNGTPPTHSAVHMIEGSFEPGDAVLLATDAMAKFLLEYGRRSSDLMKRMCSMSQQEFRRGTARLVAAGKIADDDLTLLRCHIEARENA